jgi:putative ABC transport system permease protein
MIKNYFKTAWRNLMKNKTFSFINIFGLTLGITCSLLIFLWVQDELNYDNFHSDTVCKVMLHNTDKKGNITDGSMDATPGLLPDALKNQIPEVQYAATVVWNWDMIVTVGNKITKENGRYVGDDFFKLFNFPLLQSNASTVLSSPDNIVISQKLARKYFNDVNPIGKTIRIDNKRDYIVSGVVADVPENSSLKFDFVLPIQHCFEDNGWMVSGWNHFGPATYVKVHKDADINKVNNKIKKFLTQQDATVNDKALTIVPFKDVYLHGNFTKGIPDGGRIDYVRMFSIIAAFIILIGCINFINLATARSAKRAKEVGIRKAIGAMRAMLFKQFIMEAMLTAFVAVVISIALVLLLLPWFNQVTEKQIILHFSASFIITLLSVTIVTGFIAGSYPAFVLSSFNPVKVLKGSLKFGAKNSLLRKSLVVFQFSLSIILIVCTAVVNKQMNYIETKNLGLDRSNIIYIPVQGDLGKKYAAFKNQLLQSGKIESIAEASSMPTNVNWYSDNINWDGKNPNNKAALAEMDVDYDFLKTMKIKLKEGRDFSPSFATDTSNFIVNETAVKAMNLKNPVGAMFSHQQTKGKIIGVVKDFHMHSLHDAIAPLFITLQPNMENGLAVVRAQAGKPKDALAVLESANKQYNPLFPFDYIFADDAFKQQYHDEIIIGKLSDVFALLAIIVSCMGLFGLAMFIAEQRTKEIGIRKVLGASVSGIFKMLSKDFLQLIIIASLIAFPAAWWAMQKWLQGYTYKTNISWWLFAASGLLTLIIALITISFQSIKAAIANPVKSLRTE